MKAQRLHKNHWKIFKLANSATIKIGIPHHHRSDGMVLSGLLLILANKIML